MFCTVNAELKDEQLVNIWNNCGNRAFLTQALSYSDLVLHNFYKSSERRTPYPVFGEGCHAPIALSLTPSSPTLKSEMAAQPKVKKKAGALPGLDYSLVSAQQNPDMYHNKPQTPGADLSDPNK